MIRHIAIFKLKDSQNGQSKADNVSQIKRNVEKLRENINTIKVIQAQENFHDSSALFPADDLCVLADFETRADYDFYFNHPVHKEAAHFAGAVSEYVHGITYEV
ncbi:Dabb family protein [Chitinibacter sp. GC72]|uniref:Dabb family protein n=1 Tax=Chitinibacter sp. GC72 TaxID=1526917 RepID=UPI0012F9796D|nr:Dabb family protein [Chitinibacter sp. GC72]